jgi:hypothetical protein
MAEVKSFCVVGLGPHARNKLIPALIASGQHVAGVVTSGSDAAGTDARICKSLPEALAALPSGTVFLLATPPALHAEQAKLVLEAGRDVIVEKPAFVTRAEAEEVLALAAQSGRILLEAFMQRHAHLYARALEIWAANRAEIAAIETNFLIPETSGGTSFRSQPDIASSIVFDIGCYPLALLADLGLLETTLTVAEIHAAGDLGRERIHIAGDGIDIRFGMAAAYDNSLRFLYRDGTRVEFRPFYFGRAGERTIARSPAGTVETLNEGSAFEAMLGAPRTAWAERQNAAAIVSVTAKLEQLGQELLNARKSSSLRRENL